MSLSPAPTSELQTPMPTCREARFERPGYVKLEMGASREEMKCMRRVGRGRFLHFAVGG